MKAMNPPTTETQPPAEPPGPPHDLPQALSPLVNAIYPLPNRVERLIGLADVVKQQGKSEWVVPLIRHAQSCAETDGRGQEALRRFWNLPAWHCSILNEEARAAGYESALRGLVGPDDLVLEIGAGSGILALLAARAGAGRVITCETNPYLVDVAREIVAVNGYADRITVLHTSSKKLEIGPDLPRPADVLLGDHFTGSFYPGGGLALYQDALGRLTTPTAKTLPRRGGMRLALVSCPGLATRYRPGRVAGFDCSPFRRFMPPAISINPDEWLAARPDILSEPVTPLPLAFDRLADFREETRHIALEPKAPGRVDGVVTWAWLELAEDVIWDGGTAPAQRPWNRHLHLFARPIAVSPERPVKLKVTQALDGMTISPDL